MPVAADPDLSTAVRARYVDAGVRELDRIAGQHHGAALALEAPGLDHAREIDRRACGIDGLGRADDHGAAIRHDPPRHGDAAVARGQGDLKEAVAFEVQRRAGACAQRHFAQRCEDQPGVVDLAADQRREAALDDRDGALVGDRSASAGDGDLAAHELTVAEVQRRGDEACGFHRSGRRDEDAVGVDQEDLPVRVDLPGDRGAGAPGHAVEQGGGGAGLENVDPSARTDREVVPVDDGAVAALGDGHGAARSGADGGATGGDLAAARKLLGLRCDRQQGGGGEQGERESAVHGSGVLRTGSGC